MTPFYVFKNRLTITAIFVDVTCFGASCRRCLALFFLLRKCRAPCDRCMSLPVLLILKRFRTIFLVLTFGMFLLSILSFCH
jgi:hypothetical protein